MSSEAASSESDTQIEEVTITYENGISDLTNEFHMILSESVRNFYEGYSIDDSFLLWIAAEYGDSVIEQLASCVQEGERDASIWYELTGKTIHVLWLEYCRSLNYSSYLLTDVIWVDCRDRKEFTMDFIGDINFSENWHTTRALDERGGALESCIAPEILQELASADIAMTNNEFTFSTRGTALEGKKYLFRADPLRISYYEKMGIDVVSLANNHTWDYGQEALFDTMENLTNAGVAHIGAGKNLQEAKKIQYFVANGRKIAVVSATQIERYHKYTKEATEDSAGVLKTLDPEIFLGVIEEARANSDYVIAYVHWGTEGNLYPDADERALAEKYVSAGADIVIGGHSHRLQGVTYIEEVPVLYSLGNFWFSTGDLYTSIAQVKITEDGELKVALLPCEQKNLTVTLLSEQQDTDGFYEYIADISSGIGIKEDGTICNIRDEADDDVLAGFRYLSGQSYGTHHGDLDLEGNGIDIVGNLK